MLIDFDLHYSSGTYTYHFNSIGSRLVIYPAEFIFTDIPKELNLYLVDIIASKTHTGAKNLGFSTCKILSDFLRDNTELAVGFYPLESYTMARDRLFNRVWYKAHVNDENFGTIRQEINYKGQDILIFQAYHHVSCSKKFKLVEQVETLSKEYEDKPDGPN